MRIALQVPAVLERARLAFVDVDRHHARLGLRGDDAPLAARRETGAAETAQAGVLHHFGNRVARVLPRQAIGDEFVATVLAVFGVADVRLHRAVVLFRFQRRAHAFGASVTNWVLANDRARRDFAAADAWRRNHAHVRPEIEPEKLVRPGELAGDRVAHAN